MTDPEPIFGAADFNDPVLNIGGGMISIPIISRFIGEDAPATSGFGRYSVGGMMALAGAYAIHEMNKAERRAKNTT